MNFNYDIAPFFLQDAIRKYHHVIQMPIYRDKSLQERRDEIIRIKKALRPECGNNVDLWV
jgi:hypothetical protein